MIIIPYLTYKIKVASSSLDNITSTSSSSSAKSSAKSASQRTGYTVKNVSKRYNQSGGPPQILTGGLVSPCYLLKDLNGAKSFFFVFPDLSVRIRGKYKLKFGLFNLIEYVKLLLRHFLLS
jgi:hypothetical protein